MGRQRKPFEPLSYQNALDQLRGAYRRGLLVPFVGAGLCAPQLRLWPDLVRTLASTAKGERLGARPFADRPAADRGRRAHPVASPHRGAHAG